MRRKGKHFLVTSSENSLESTAFAEEISRWMLDGCSNIFFILADSAGSIMFQSFPYLLLIWHLNYALLFFEQIYRGYRIMNCQPYHK